MIYVVPVVICVGLIFIPESPRWLLEHDQPDKARKALAWLRPHPERVEEELSAIQAGIDQEKSLKASVSVWDMFTDPVDRRRTILSVAAINTQAASGAMFIIGKLNNTLDFDFVLTCLSIWYLLLRDGWRWQLIPKFLYLDQRRSHRHHPQHVHHHTLRSSSPFPHYWTAALRFHATHHRCRVHYQAWQSSGVQGHCSTQHTLYVQLQRERPSVISDAFANKFLQGLIATYAWLSGGEIPSQRLRSYTFGLAASIGFIGAWLATFTAPYFINPSALNWGPRYGYIWFPSCMVAAVFIYFFLPEIKDRTLEEISEMFEAGLPARKFKGYKCVGATAVVAAEKKEKGHEIEVSTQEVVWRDPKAASESAAVVG